MCVRCHCQLSDENLKRMFLDAKETKNFQEWNCISISHLVLAVLSNGQECKILALELLEEYIIWAKNNPELYKSKMRYSEYGDIVELEIYIEQLKSSNKTLFHKYCVII
jgi:hypothetical protein